MEKHSKLKDKILSGNADNNIGFVDLCRLLIYLGFDRRIKGDHHIFTRDDLMEIINLQPRANKAKPYQVKQVREIIVKYRLEDSDADAD